MPGDGTGDLALRGVGLDWPDQTLDQLEGVDWGEPTYSSYVVTNTHRLRKKPLREFTPEDLRFMLGQQISLPILMPMALDGAERRGRGGTNPPPFPFGHDPARRVYRLTVADGTVETFRDNPARYLCVEPDPETGAMRPVIKRARPVSLDLCRGDREAR